MNPPFAFEGPPQAALVDRAHALLALRAANFVYGHGCDCSYESRYGEALARTFWVRASTMPWTVEAWHLFISSPGKFGGNAFDPWDDRGAACRRLRAFALALVLPSCRSKIAELPEKKRCSKTRSTYELDLFGCATHWVTYAKSLMRKRSWSFVPTGGAQSELEPHPMAGFSSDLIRGEKCKRQFSSEWRDNSIDERRDEPPADGNVIPNFCAFSFWAGLHDVHKPAYNYGCACCTEKDQERRGGVALRVVDFASPNDEREAPVLLDKVKFEMGAVHLDFKVEGSPLVLTVSGMVCSMPPAEESTTFLLRHWKKGAARVDAANKADEKYFEEDYFVGYDSIYEGGEHEARTRYLAARRSVAVQAPAPASYAGESDAGGEVGNAVLSCTRPRAIC